MLPGGPGILLLDDIILSKGWHIMRIISAFKSGSLRKQIGLAFISPWIIGFILFQLYPFLNSLVYSFTNFDLIRSFRFVGLKNYITMFTNDELFFQSLKVTLIYAFVAVPCKIVFSLLIAMVLNVRIKYVNIFRTIYYLPSILGGSVAISLLWNFLFMHDGLINKITGYIGIPAVDWLGNPSIALYTISLLTVWQFGSSMVIFLAGLKQIPKDMYEAGRVDGASSPRMFLSITLPMLSPLILFNLVMQMIFALQEFTAAFIITKGGPLYATYLYGMMLYRQGFQFFKMGYAAALSWVLFVIIIILTLLIFKSSPLWTFYDDGSDLK